MTTRPAAQPPFLFYAEPTRTYDLDVFVILPAGTADLAPLSDIYWWTRDRGFATIGEHVMIHDVPVQFLAGHHELVLEAVADAR